MLEWIKKHQPTMALIGATIALFGAFVAYRQSSHARVASEASAYLTMRNRYFEVWSKLPEHYEDLDVRREDYKNFQLFKSYWYVSFDEWYVTQKIGAFSDLWSDYYEYAYLRSIDKKSMRTSLCLLREHEFKDGVGRDFVRAIEDLYSRNHDGQSMCP